MRMRWIGLAAVLLLVTGLVALSRPDGRAGAQDATPAADATPEPDDGPSRIVTLIGWYSLAENGDELNVVPLQTNANLVAGPIDDATGQLTGAVDFVRNDNDGLPWLRIGDAEFYAFALSEDDPDSAFRWIYYNEDPSLRPATLVIQIEGITAPYEGWVGTATFISRAADPSSGVLVVILNPPEE